MNKSLCLQLLIITTILPVFSTNAMDQKSKGNNTSQKRTIDTSNQQATQLTAAANNPGLIGSASRYLSQWGEAGQREIIGLASQEERNKTEAIYKEYKSELENGSVEATLAKQLDKRRKITIEYAEYLIKTLKQGNYRPQEIEDGSNILKFPNINSILPAFLHDLLNRTITEVAQKEEEKYKQIRENAQKRKSKESEDQIDETFNNETEDSENNKDEETEE